MTNEDFQETYRINHIYKTEGFKGVINYAKDKLQQYGAVKEVEKGFDFANTIVAFAVKWIPALVPDTVVIDYGLPVYIDVAQNDALAAVVKGIGTNKVPVPNSNNGTYVDMNHGTYKDKS